VPETQQRQSPLAHLGFGGRIREDLDGAGVGLADRGFRTLIDLRLELRKDPKAADSFEKAAGFRLPETPNTAAGGSAAYALWLGPNEWQIVVPEDAPDTAPAWVDRLRTGLAGHSAAVVDVSHAQAILGVTGPKARDVLEGAVPLDLHPRAFKPGEVKQTLFGKHCGVTLHLRDETPDFDVYTRRSFAEYVWRYLEDCARGACTDVAVLAR